MSFLKPKTYNLQPNTGQTMILTVLVFSSTLLSVTLIGGFIMLYQIRHAGDFTNSARAIFAADTGVNWWTCFSSGGCTTPANSSLTINGLFDNGASFEIKEETAGIKVIGRAGNSKRAFLLESLISATCEPDVMLVIDANDNLSNSEKGTYENQLKFFVDELSSSTYGQAYMGIAVSLGNNASLAQGLTSSTSTLRLKIDALAYFDQFNLSDALRISESQLINNGRDDSFHPNYIVVTTDRHPDRPVNSAYAEADAAATSTVIKAAGITIVVASIDDASPEGSVWHGYYQSLASPDHYVSSTDPGAYDGSFRQILQKVNDDWLSICR